jgi:tape measure domain-containing protein
MADKEVSLKLGVDAVKARTNLKEFKGDFEETLRVVGKSDEEIQAFRQTIRQIETGKVRLQDLDTETQKYYATYQQGAAAARAADALGVRSERAVEEEIKRVQAAYTLMAASGKFSQEEMAVAATSVKQKIAALRGETAKTERSFMEMGENVKGAFEAIAAAEVVRKFAEVNVEFEAVHRTLVQVTGSSEAAAREFEWLSKTSDKLGIDALEASKAYMGLATATKGTALEGQKTHEIFTAVASSMARLGKSSADTEGALEAITQMVSKGTVSMEEFRKQLSERVPGAMKATADAMGVTTGELDTMISSGKVLAVDLIPKISEGLNKLNGTGQIDGAAASWNRLKNSIDDTFIYLGKIGVMDAAIKAIGWLTDGVKLFGVTLETVGKQIGINYGFILNFDFRHPLDSLRQYGQETMDNLRQGAAEAKKVFAGAEESAKDASKSQSELADKTKDASDQASKGAASWLGVVNTYEKLAKTAEENVLLATKSAEARKQEAQASQALIQSLGTETEKREASLAASRIEADALQKVSDAKNAEAKVLEDQANALKKAAEAEGEVSAEKAKAIKAAQDSATAKRAEADQAKAASNAARDQTAILAVNAETLKDNSARVDELRIAYERAQSELKQMQIAVKAGKQPQDALTGAQTKAVQAAALYRDALSDVTAAIKAKSAAAQASNSLAQAEVSLAIQQKRDAADLAQAEGDGERAIELKNEASRMEIKLSQLKAEALRLEAAAQLELIKAQRAELLASGQLTPVKEAELKALEAQAKVKQVEADMADETAKHLRQMASASDEVREASDNAGASERGFSSNLDGVSSSANRATQSLKSLFSQQQAMRPPSGMGSAGGSETGAPTENSGISNPGVMPRLSGPTGREPDGLKVEQMRNMGWSATDIENYQLKNDQRPAGTIAHAGHVDTVDNAVLGRAAGVSDANMDKFSEKLSQVMGKHMAKLNDGFHIGSNEEYSRRFGSRMTDAVNEAAAYARNSGPSAAKPIEINLNINGEKTHLYAKTQSDADALVKALEGAKGTSA